MCIAVPGKLVDIFQQDEMLCGTVEFQGLSRPICLDLIPEAQIGDYVLVYTGFARQIIDEQEADILMQLNEEMAMFLAVEP